MRHDWKDRWGNAGSIETYSTDGGIIHVALQEDDGSNMVAHDLDIPTARALYEAMGQALADVDRRQDTLQKIDAECERGMPAPILHPRPFFWRDGDDFGWINIPNSRTTEALLLQTPDALNALELNSSDAHGPVFGFDVPTFLSERTRWPKVPFRTLREYLEAP